jgi:toxin ParE1/3/4
VKRAFRPEPQASAELEDAAVWYESRRPGLGTEFLEAVDRALDQIDRWPEIGRRVVGVRNDVRARQVPVNRFPYHVVYLDWHGVIRLLAFAHDRRKPGYWFSRIDR